MKARNGEKIGELFVITAHRDLTDLCAVCDKDIWQGQQYVRGSRRSIRYSILAHYRCALRAEWDKK